MLNRIYLACLLALVVGCGGGSTTYEVVMQTLFSIPLSWTVPQKNIDGTALTDIANYKVRYGVSATVLPNEIIVPAAQTSLTISNLAKGTYFITVATVNSQGQESTQAGPVSVTVQ